jgi:hypothetical protein
LKEVSKEKSKKKINIDIKHLQDLNSAQEINEET